MTTLKGQGRVYADDAYLATVEYHLTTRQTIDGLLDTDGELQVTAGERDLMLDMAAGLTLRLASGECWGLVITQGDITQGRYQVKVNH